MCSDIPNLCHILGWMTLIVQTSNEDLMSNVGNPTFNLIILVTKVGPHWCPHCNVRLRGAGITYYTCFDKNLNCVLYSIPLNYCFWFIQQLLPLWCKQKHVWISMKLSGRSNMTTHDGLEWLNRSTQKSVIHTSELLNSIAFSRK